ncbi:MAG TPA: class 1 fructose-bisphosphatase [Deltaproteobacteria bacterium]|nr:class 1 fructose-bisphosphatase [Deltaproteobacteria bacterium]
MNENIVTLERHILEEQRKYGGRGDFSSVLSQLVFAAKIVSAQVSKAGLVDILGNTGDTNIQGEEVQKLDVYANKVFINALNYIGRVCVMASEEEKDIILIPDKYPKGDYVVMFDPLDGSSNVDAGVSIGTIFSIYRRKSKGPGDGSVEDCLQPGHFQYAAGYIIYSTSTIFVYTTGAGVNGFTLDPAVGEFVLSHPDIRIPERGKIYSINEGYYNYWKKGTREYIDYLKSDENSIKKPYSLRYIGSLVADFHRNLLYGGIFLYPEDTKDPKRPTGKLRLLYEANPLAYVVEQAGGYASTGYERILDVEPDGLHQRVPLIIGSKLDVLEYEEFAKKNNM